MNLIFHILFLLQLATKQSGKHSVTIRWNPPSPNAATIVAVQVFRSQNANLSSPVMVCNVAPSVPSCVDNTTTPNQTYWFYAISVGTQANSPKSNVSKITVHP